MRRETQAVHPQPPHLLFGPLHVFSCRVRVALREKDFCLHFSHTKGLTPACTRRCRASEDESLN